MPRKYLITFGTIKFAIGMVFLDEYLKLKNELPPGVRLIAVSKFKPLNDIELLYRETGHVDFGENRALELADKASRFDSAQWHFIGHLQTNKVKYILPYVSLIHSVDSSRLLAEINKEAAKAGKLTKILLQFHIATEETKYGFSIVEAFNMLESREFISWKNIEVCGVMGMATYTDSVEQVRKEFRELKAGFDQLKMNYFSDAPGFREISMGMSGDYKIAIEEGSTMIRVGSIIFGER